MLLRECPDPQNQGTILDIGCGWGPIALDSSLRAPGAEVWAVDVNARSLELCAENAQKLGLSQIHTAQPEEVPKALTFTDIRSNPPIRVGKEQLHDILRTWIPRLSPGGTAYFVVAKHLGAPSLQHWLAQEFAQTHEITRYARDKGFHVISATAFDHHR